MDHNFKLVWLITNYSCNNRCKYCYAGSDTNEKAEQLMSKSTLKDSINLCNGLGVSNLLFIGGEPTLYPHLQYGISLAKKNINTVGLVTNGRKLKNDVYLDELISAGLDYVSISVEGHKADIHDQITMVKGSFFDTMQGLEKCLVRGLKVGTETTISPMNKEYLKETLLLLKNLGLKKASINLCSPPFNNPFSQYTINLIEGADIIQELFKYGKGIGIDIQSITPLPMCNFDLNIWAEMKTKKLVNSSCHIFYGTNFVIDYNGGILPCVHFSGIPITSIYNQNNLLKTSKEFKDDFLCDNSLSAKLRDKLWQYPIQDCIDDDCFGKQCFGGCPIYRISGIPLKELIKGHGKNKDLQTGK